MVDFDSNVRRINGRKQPHILLEAVSYLQRDPLSSSDNADKIWDLVPHIQVVDKLPVLVPS